jgi:type III pantothenate kinase
MLLAVDIGNTNVKLGLFDGDTPAGHLRIAVSDASSGEKIVEFIKHTTSGRHIEAAIAASVVPDLTGRVVSIVRPYLDVEPHIVSHITDTGLTFSIPEPGRLGADRITAAAWAYHHFGAPAAVIDFGTATTISVVGRGGAFIGGAIIPGLRTMALAFKEHTAALPLVGLDAPPGAALGIDTRSAIISGIVYGTAGAVSRIVYQIEREIGYNIDIAVTGGNLALIEPCLERIDVVEPELWLKGLKTIHERMR